MGARLSSRLAALLMAGVVSVGCGTQAPSELPAVDTLVKLYDQRSAVWPTTGWWNSTNALTALTDYMITSGDRRYVWLLENTTPRSAMPRRATSSTTSPTTRVGGRSPGSGHTTSPATTGT